jgi:HlyD family secretion protein
LAIVSFLAFVALGITNFVFRPQLTPSDPSPQKILGISAWGRLAPSGEIITLVPASNIDGARVEMLVVNEGDQVEAGQTIAVLGTRPRRQAALNEALRRLDVARARLEQVSQGAEHNDIRAQESVVRRLEFDLDNAMKADHRIDTLFKRGAATDEQRDNALWKRQQAEANLEQMKAQLARLKTVRPIDLKVAESEVAQAEANVRVAEADLAATQVVSPTPGTVLRVHARAGQRIGEEGIIEIGDIRQMHAVAEVYEEDIGRISPGMRATVRVPGLDWIGHGTVVSQSRVVSRKIIFSNDPVSDTDARVVETRIELDPPDSQKVAHLSNARVEVVIDTP